MISNNIRYEIAPKIPQNCIASDKAFPNSNNSI